MEPIQFLRNGYNQYYTPIFNICQIAAKIGIVSSSAGKIKPAPKNKNRLTPFRHAMHAAKMANAIFC